jgi:hypothetical protein
MTFPASAGRDGAVFFSSQARRVRPESRLLGALLPSRPAHPPLAIRNFSRQSVAHARNAAVDRRAPWLVMAAHDGGYAQPFFEKGKRRVCDRVVV